MKDKTKKILSVAAIVGFLLYALYLTLTSDSSLWRLQTGHDGILRSGNFRGYYARWQRWCTGSAVEGSGTIWLRTGQFKISDTDLPKSGRFFMLSWDFLLACGILQL